MRSLSLLMQRVRPLRLYPKTNVWKRRRPATWPSVSEIVPHQLPPTWSLWLPCNEALRRLRADFPELRRRRDGGGNDVRSEPSPPPTALISTNAVLLLLCVERSSARLPITSNSNSKCWASFKVATALGVAVVTVPISHPPTPNCPLRAVTNMPEAVEPLRVSIFVVPPTTRQFAAVATAEKEQRPQQLASESYNSLKGSIAFEHVDFRGPSSASSSEPIHTHTRPHRERDTRCTRLAGPADREWTERKRSRNRNTRKHGATPGTNVVQSEIGRDKGRASTTHGRRRTDPSDRPTRRAFSGRSGQRQQPKYELRRRGKSRKSLPTPVPTFVPPALHDPHPHKDSCT